MARFEYDRGLFAPPTSGEWTDESVDDAHEIGVSVVEPNQEMATPCKFDKDGHLIYGEEEEEVPFLSYTDEIELDPQLGGDPSRITRIAESADKGLKSHTLLYSAFPYSTNKRGKARLKVSRKDIRRTSEFWSLIASELAGGKRFSEVVDEYDYDLWLTDKPYLTARFFEPRLDAAGAFSGRQASKKDYEQAAQELEGRRDRMRRVGGLRPELASIYRPVAIVLWGICADYDKAYQWLQTHSDIATLVNAAYDGDLFVRFPNPHAGGRPPRLHQEAIALSDAVLEASIHNVLCGTFKSDEYRGVVDDKKDKNKKHKQTVATHLKHVFLDTMDNLHRRAVRNMPVSMAAELQYLEASDSAEELSKRFDEMVAICSDKLDELEPRRRGLYRRIVEALLSNDIELCNWTLAECVALSRTGELPDNVVDVIRALGSHENSAISEAARKALERLQRDGE